MENEEKVNETTQNIQNEENENITNGNIIVITGLSGAGKSLALKCLEDMDYFCVDNLLPGLIPKFVQLCATSDMNKIAFVIDIRGRKFFKELLTALKEIPNYGFKYKIIFFEASDAVLIRRFSETRRRHPLAHNGRLLDGITFERKQLEEIRKIADKIIDTSTLSQNKLKNELSEIIGVTQTPDSLNINVIAFGFKYGIPLDADLIFDVRFLPNPYYVNELRHLTGNDEPVKDYLTNIKETKEYLEKFLDFNLYLIPKFIAEGKANLTIGIGCTGGRHRSVFIANELSKALAENNYKVQTEYRELKT